MTEPREEPERSNARPASRDSRQETQRFVEDLHDEFLRLRAQGEEITIEEFAGRYPDLAEAIVGFHSACQNPEGAGDSATFARVERLGFPAAETGLSGPLALPGKLLAEVRPGSTLGSCEIVEKLGESTFGVVFRARHPVRSDVAVKVLRLASPEAVLRFQVEFHALARMNHPYIARVFEAGVTDGGLLYYVMEHVEGEWIQKHCDRLALGLRQRLELFLKVCEAVHHAHLRGTIHRDLKPANILVSSGEGGVSIPRLIDFGLVKAVGWGLEGRPLEETQPGQLLGTLNTMSPEQAAGREVDARTDVYSLGVVLYDLLTGVLPVDLREVPRGNLAEVQRRICEVPPRSPASALSRRGEKGAAAARSRGLSLRSLRRELRSDLGRIVLAALEKEPDHRYQSVLELSHDIRRYLRCEPIRVMGPSPFYRLRKLLWRKRAAMVPVVAVLLFAALGGGIALYRSESRLSRTVEEAMVSLARKDFDAAAVALGFLREQYPARSETETLGRELVRGLHEKALATWQDYEERHSRAQETRKRWLEERTREPQRRPAWARAEELRAWQELQETRSGLAETYNEVLFLLAEASSIALPGWEEAAKVSDSLGRIYFRLYQDARRDDSVFDLPGFFLRMVRRQGTSVADALETPGTIRLSTVPAGASVHCFRYEHVASEARLLPLPYHPDRGVVGRPFLRVERVWEPALCPFQRGDRIARAAGRTVETPGDLARALAAAARLPGVALRVEVVREGRPLEVDWVPYPAVPSAAARRRLAELEGEVGGEDGGPPLVTSFFHQLGFTLEGYPLELTRENLLGRTEERGTLEAVFPPGSYLLVLRKEGFAEARLPFAVPREEGEGGVAGLPPPPVRLVRLEEVPPGFVYIPPGELAAGGDPHAFQSQPYGIVEVAGFFISRFEVTTQEWLEFVNDETVRGRIDGEGRLDPSSAEVREELERARVSRVLVIPGSGKTLWWSRESDTGAWHLDERYYPARYGEERRRWPVFAIPQLAAREYAQWRTAKARSEGRPWRFRLPTDLEWERAARGADRRHFVWGDYLVWGFCWSHRGIPFGTRRPEVCGVQPFDESVFGVRDLTGSAREHTSGRPLPGLPNTSYRGGSWNDLDEEYFRAATRNTLVPWDRYPQSGVRLVAEPAEGDR